MDPGVSIRPGILAFDGTDQRDLLEIGRSKTLQFMAPHVSNVGVHDHGFNNLSTYGNLRRLMREKRIKPDEWEMSFYELAIKTSGAVQAARWTTLAEGDTSIRSMVRIPCSSIRYAACGYWGWRISLGMC